MRNKPIGIAIIAPSGYAPDNDAVLQAVSELEAQNCQVYNYYQHEKRHQRFGGEDALRLDQIRSAVLHPDVDIVLALRGGYGMSRLLPYIDFEQCAKSNKLFVGHSDFTVFHLALMQKTRSVSFAGPMLCNDFSRKDKSRFTLDHFWKCLKGPEYAVKWVANGNPKIDVSGVLWGGNLTMITHLLGTQWMPKVENGILFIEDINEHPYRIERMILQLLHSGVLANQQALVLGDFSEYTLTGYDNGYDFEMMLSWIRSCISIPVITGLPFGHIKDKITLPVGAQSRLVSDGKAVNLTAKNYPALIHKTG